MASGTKYTLNSPFIKLVGLELRELEDGETCVELELRPELLNIFGVAHGGVSMTMMDVAMGQAAHRADPHAIPGEKGRSVMTVEMKTSFLKPALLGKLTAHGRVIQATHSLAFTEGWVCDTEGVRLAHATGTFKYMRKKDA